VRVSLFMDPVPEQMAAARPSAPTAWSSTPSPLPPPGERPSSRAAAHAAAAQAALDAGLGINAGHDLNRDNLPAFVAQVPGLAEVSIGHALIADALELGYAETARLPACIDAGMADRAEDEGQPRWRFVAAAWRHFLCGGSWMIYGIGTDICDVRRIRASLEKHGERFARKVLAMPNWRPGRRAASAGPSAASATWPRAFRPRRRSARPSAWAWSCP
jgi:hypothetical protein